MNSVASLNKAVFFPLSRAYSKHFVGNKPADGPLALICALYFRHVFGYWPDLKNPRTFREKLWHRMLYSRDPLLTRISDKLKVRDYVAAKVGGQYLIPLLWQGSRSDEIPYDDLPPRFVIKANHGCGYNIVVTEKSKIDRVEQKRKIDKWLSQNFCEDKYLGIAWGYKNIEPKILIESYLGDGGSTPVDYKLYCFSGRIELITLHFDRFGAYKTMAVDRNFERIPGNAAFEQFQGDCRKPRNYESLIRVAELLAQDFGFIRVDLYNLHDTIYFGELTPYPGGVSILRAFDLSEHDIDLGRKWKRSARVQY